MEELIGGVQVMLRAYAEGRIDRLVVVYNRFVNTMTQAPTFLQLAPLPPTEEEGYGHSWDYLYEPDARELIEGLITRYIESEVYQAVVENTACEQAAKMIAMKNATENAGQLGQRQHRFDGRSYKAHTGSKIRHFGLLRLS